MLFIKYDINFSSITLLNILERVSELTLNLVLIMLFK